MFKIMIRDNMSGVAREILEATGQIKVVVDNNKDTGSLQKLSELLQEFDGLAVRSGTKVPSEIFSKTNRLKVIGRAGIGVDNIDVKAATRAGVVVMNAPGGNTVTTAEHTIALIFSLARNIPQATASIRENRWDKKTLTGVELTDKTLGIVGFGHIGRVVADRMLGMKMRVIAADPFVSEEAARSLGVQLVPLNVLLAKSDFITLHVPRLADTVNLINAQTLAETKPGVRIINCSRGEVVNLDDLYRAVDSGHVSGAALDVFPQEPPDYSHPLFQHPRIIFTPHLGASTGEAQRKVAEMIANQMANYLINGVITNAVNFPSLTIEEMKALRPYLDLSEKLGAFVGQLVSKIHNVNITYCGNMTQLDTKHLTHAVLKGILSAFTHNPVNYVNALTTAADKGIRVTETFIEERDDFAGSVRIKLEGIGDGPDEIWGTLFSKKHPRIVRLGRIYMDAIPEGYMIVIQNLDKPGVIGNVGTLLGKHNINIGRFQLGRREDRAFCLVNIDTAADRSVIEEIRNLPNILYATQVHL
jgi:D-3-phosphoglycerate dehydrogenase